jgi:cytochrome c-type protein NapC
VPARTAGKIWEAIKGDSKSPGTVVLRVAIAGLVALAGILIIAIAGATGLAWTSTQKFCISCHEMRDNVYAEFQDTIHDKNRAGVHVVCSDCHVPHAPGPLIWRKMGATFEIWGKITGVIDTKEKFKAHRAELAKRVWTRMLTTNSLECRNCHKPTSFDPDKQSDKAKSRHAKAEREGMTCIECHYAIAHDEPEGPGPQELKKKLGIGKQPWIVN